MHLQEEMNLIPHIRDEDLKVPFADKHTMQKFLEREFDRLNALVTNVEGTRDVHVSAPDGITLRIEPLEGILEVQFNHADHLGANHANSGALICNYCEYYVKIKLRSTGRQYEIYREPRRSTSE